MFILLKLPRAKWLREYSDAYRCNACARQRKPLFYKHLQKTGTKLVHQLVRVCTRLTRKGCVQRVGYFFFDADADFDADEFDFAEPAFAGPGLDFFAPALDFVERSGVDNLDLDEPVLGLPDLAGAAFWVSFAVPNSSAPAEAAPLMAPLAAPATIFEAAFAAFSTSPVFVELPRFPVAFFLLGVVFDVLAAAIRSFLLECCLAEASASAVPLITKRSQVDSNGVGSPVRTGFIHLLSRDCLINDGGSGPGGRFGCERKNTPPLKRWQ